MAGRGKPENPLKGKVVEWVQKTNEKKPFESVKAGVEAATEHFKKEELPSTLRQWVMEGMGVEPKKREGTSKKKNKEVQQEVFTFDSALQQIEAIKAKMVDGLKNQYQMILEAQTALDEQKKKLEEDVASCAKLTGSSVKEINSQLNQVQ